MHGFRCGRCKTTYLLLPKRMYSTLYYVLGLFLQELTVRKLTTTDSSTGDCLIGVCGQFAVFKKKTNERISPPPPPPPRTRARAEMLEASLLGHLIKGQQETTIRAN